MGDSTYIETGRAGRLCLPCSASYEPYLASALAAHRATGYSRMGAERFSTLRTSRTLPYTQYRGR
jgi:hypothetical protein